jgi:YHS domain-containing protein
MDIDPVCGMAVERPTAVSAERAGVTYYFCARGCMAEFLAQEGTREVGRLS